MCCRRWWQWCFYDSSSFCRNWTRWKRGQTGIIGCRCNYLLDIIIITFKSDKIIMHSYINIFFFQFSLLQFSHISRLLLVHGRNSYKRSASLSQFVIHRGLIITTMQAIFSAVFYFSSISLYQGFLMVGYATVYTMFPVFSLVLDKDVSFPFG